MQARNKNSSSSLIKNILLIALLLCPFSDIARAAKGQQKANQQRPRRVTDSQSQSGTKNSSNSSAEEVDEGDVVRVETQLVSVPAVVTTALGRPLAGLKPENFLVFEDGQPQ